MEPETLKFVITVGVGIICGSLATLAIQQLVDVLHPRTRKDWSRASDTPRNPPTYCETVLRNLDKLDQKYIDSAKEGL